MDTKTFKNCKVAVCLSGESRFFRECAESIKQFFSSIDNNQNEYVFFGHTWNANNYKIWEKFGVVTSIEPEKLDYEKTKSDLQACFNFEKLEIEEQFLNHDFCLSTTYSRMKSNFLKQQYEIENNMMFDLVIKSRFDICFDPSIRFEHCFRDIIEEKVLYSQYGFYRGEFYFPNPDEVFYYGTSLTMDIIEGLYNVISTDAFDKINRNTGPDNLVWHKSGPGALIHRWMALRNILPKNALGIPYAVYRKQAKDMGYDALSQFKLVKSLEQGPQI